VTADIVAGDKMKLMALVLLLILLCCPGYVQSYCTPAQDAITQQQWLATFGSDRACVHEFARQVYHRSVSLSSRINIVPKTLYVYVSKSF